MTGNNAKTRDNSAAIAAQFGVSIKALRLYERLGMLAAPRTQAGWRVYGKPEIARLHVIISLKQLGLPLARIAELLQSGKTDLNVLLSVQEELLRETQRETDHALALIQVARKRLSESTELTADELAAMVQGISRTIIRWTPELDALAKRFYTPEQLSKVVGQEHDAETLARASAAWTSFYAELDEVMRDGDPHSERALGVVRRMVALIRQNTAGDRELWNSAARFWAEAVNDPQTAPQIPMTKAHYDFVGAGMQELMRRGELVL